MAADLTNDQASMCLEGVKAWVWIQTAAVVLTLGASVASEDVALPILSVIDSDLARCAAKASFTPSIPDADLFNVAGIKQNKVEFILRLPL